MSEACNQLATKKKSKKRRKNKGGMSGGSNSSVAEGATTDQDMMPKVYAVFRREGTSHTFNISEHIVRRRG